MPPKGADEVSRVSNQACWLGNPRRGCGIAPTPIFQKPRAQWPGRNRRKPLRFCAPEMFCPPQGVTPVNGVRGKATMSTKCSSGAVPGGVLGYLSRTPGEAQRSGFAGKRRSKGAGAVFAVRRKRRQADFATTSRHGQSNSPPAGGETPREQRNPFRNLPPHPPPSGAPSPIPSVAARHLPLIRGVGPQGEGFSGGSL